MDKAWTCSPEILCDDIAAFVKESSKQVIEMEQRYPQWAKIEYKWSISTYLRIPSILYSVFINSEIKYDGA